MVDSQCNLKPRKMRCVLFVVGLLVLMTSAWANPYPESDRTSICQFLGELEVLQGDAYKKAVKSTKKVVAEMINDLATCEELQAEVAIMREYLDRGKSIGSDSSVQEQLSFLNDFPTNYNLTTRSLVRCMHAPPLLARTVLGFVSSLFSEFPELDKKLISGGNLLKEAITAKTLDMENHLFQLLEDYESETNRLRRHNLLDQILRFKFQNDCQ